MDSAKFRDGASPTYALFLKSRIVGENPLQLERFSARSTVRRSARQAGGVCAIEMALWDIAGKVYNAPVYAMVGRWQVPATRFCLSDTTESKDPKIYAQRMKNAKTDGSSHAEDDLGI